MPLEFSPVRYAIDASGLSRVYRSDSEEVWAVRNVDMLVPTGHFVCVFGPSGSGKSTLLNLCAGLDDPTAGALRVLGEEMTTLDEDAKARLRLERVGVVFQDHHLIEEFTAIENVMLPLEARGLSASQARDDAMEQLRRVDMAKQCDRAPGKLSDGQRQRVGIARALAGGRMLLLADEPTGALDSTNAHALFALLKTLCLEGTTVVLATHSLASRDYADSVWQMKDGSLRSDLPVPA
jgi:putative ABC transport system ATP-binding protein